MEVKSDKQLILDLDETLIHSSESDLGYPSDFQFDRYFVYRRPHLEQFLKEISKHYTVGLWSSADDSYVEEIVKNIKPLNVDFELAWGRSRCTMKRDYSTDSYYFEKRLEKLKSKGFRLEQILIVDDSPEKSRNNYGNAVYIKEYLGDQEDQELLHLYNYLLTLKTVENIRKIEKRGWRTSQLSIE